MQRLRALAPVVIKVLVAVALIAWLLHGNSLDFKLLGILVERPVLALADVSLFVFVVITSALRWRALLAVAGIHVPLPRVMQLQAAAMFFNAVIPGAVGGDVLKAFYVARDTAPDKRPSILLVAFVDRIVGLAALLILGGLIVGSRAGTVLGNAALRPLAIPVLLLGAGAILGPALLVLVMRKAGHTIQEWTSGPSRISRLLAQLVAGLRLLSAKPAQLFVVLGLAISGHAAAIGYFTLLARAITAVDIPFSSIATIFPLGLLTVVLPISPAGMGVGHIAFDRLFAAAGLTGGANVFNVYILGGFPPVFLGLIPYLALRRTGGPTSADQGEGEGSP